MSDSVKILIVEDDENLAEMLSSYFHDQGYLVDTTSWGEDAVKLVNEGVPDLITLDIHLPDINGYEVCRRIRGIRRARQVPVIFLTERQTREDRLTGLELGAVDYITKPFDIRELSLRVQNSLRRSQLRTLYNPVSGLPEGQVVMERLKEMLGHRDWAIVVAGFDKVDRFRNDYGFVAADDVSRAASLLIKKALEASDAEKAFIGHLNPADFLIITTPTKVGEIARSCLVRLETSIPYFYPVLDYVNINPFPRSEHLTARVFTFTSEDRAITNFEQLRNALLARY